MLNLSKIKIINKETREGKSFIFFSMMPRGVIPMTHFKARNSISRFRRADNGKPDKQLTRLNFIPQDATLKNNIAIKSRSGNSRLKSIWAGILNPGIHYLSLFRFSSLNECPLFFCSNFSTSLLKFDPWMYRLQKSKKSSFLPLTFHAVYSGV